MSATYLARDQALRALADALIRLAEGNQIERDWLIEHLATSE